MAERSLADFALFINRQLDVQRKMEARLWNADALLNVSLLTANFYEVPKDSLHCYFSLLSELIDEVIDLNQANGRDLITQLS